MRHILVAATMMVMSLFLTFAMAAVLEHRAVNTVSAPFVRSRRSPHRALGRARSACA